MRIVVLGATGRMGGYLVPWLVEAGHQVITVSRGSQPLFRPHAAWKAVQHITLDREAEDAAGTLGPRLRALRPDVVIDNICYTLESARHLVQALTGQVSHFLMCGTIWVHGPSSQVPTSEEQPRRPFGEYGIQKAAIEAYVLEQARRYGFPATVLHPGHIVGPGWAPLNPAGNFNLRVFSQLARGEELVLPNLGLETVHHVHAEDVAQGFWLAMTHRSVALGESFHIVSPGALTLRGYAEAVAAWFGQPPRLRFLPWDEWRKTVSEEDAQATWDHIAHSPHCSIRKAERLLGYHPRYTSLQAVFESLQWLIHHGKLEV